MVFSSVIFLLYFLPIFLLVYYFIDKKYKNYWILLASSFFYAWGAPKFIFAVVGTAVLDYFLVNQLHKSTAQKRRKAWLFCSLLLNLGMLAYFKYSNFFVENLNALLQQFGIEGVGWTSVLLPIGISFYIFQSITYAVDVYRRVHPPVENISHYLLYILSFPQMIAGPIVKFNAIADQLAERNETIDDQLLGFFRFCIGLAKKVLIANVMAVQADALLNGDLTSLSTTSAWIGVIAYTFQIYFDFSGYSDMAIGLGRMMGFKFPENFNSPYLSKSISEFWRRWHMTLGGFMKEYLYIPLGGNRVKIKRLYFNLIIVFTLSGLWHGASWNFVLWGAFHGVFLILDRMFLVRLLEKMGGFFATLITFLIVVVGWAIFRMENFESMKLVLKKMFVPQYLPTQSLEPDFIPLLIIAVFFSFVTAFNWGTKLEEQVFYKSSISLKELPLVVLIAVSLLFLSVASIVASDFNPFIYFRF